MLRYRLFLMTLAVVCALVATFAWHVLFNGVPSSEEAMVQVPVAMDNIPAMTVVEKIQLQMVEMPVEEASKLNIITQESDIVGKQIFEGVEKGSPFLKSNIQSDKAQAPFYLPEGYRAITIDNSPLIGVAGYLEQGMYVDILWSYKTETPDKQKVMRTAVALQNVKVLAVKTAGTADSGAAETGTVTLMLKLHDAKWLTEMTEMGKIKLVLRPSSTEKTESIVPIIPDAPTLPADIIIIKD